MVRSSSNLPVRALLVAPSLALCLGICANASAQNLAVSVDEVEPAPTDADGMLNVYSAETLEQGNFEISLIGSYSEDPTVVTEEYANDDAQVNVADRMTMNFMGGVGVTDWFEIGLAVPVELYEGSSIVSPVSGDRLEDENASLGDVRVVPAFELYDSTSVHDRTGFRVSVLADTRLPTGTEQEVRPDGFRIEPMVAVDADTSSKTRLSVNAGYIVRTQDEVEGFDVSDAVSYGLGATVALNSLVALSPELSGQIDVDNNEDFDIEDVPLQGLMGVALTPADDLIVSVRAGAAFTESFDRPDFRSTVGLTYAFGHDGMDNDRDGDGILADVDECPDSAEDFDGFMDDDGCIDADNDMDTIADISDTCPNTPEDFDGYADVDGCADLDNDFDGVPDTDDFCATVAEDFDGHADLDGCPDVTTTTVGMTCNAVTVDNDVHFDTDSAVLTESARSVLDDVAVALNAAESVELVQIQGYADQRASEEYNYELSRERAIAVRDYLVSRNVAAGRLEVVGLGEQALNETDMTDSALLDNRRVEFIIEEPPVICIETATRELTTLPVGVPSRR